MINSLRKALLPGVTWKHPLVNAGLHALDPLDWGVRSLRGRARFPRLSLRARSNGVRGQFGGARFERLGGVFAEILRVHAGLTPNTRTLEIGCGCGRNAFALAGFLDDGMYFGVDIDEPSIRAATSNAFLMRKGFDFRFLDVDNPEYNPNGRYKASEYRFDFEDEAFDLVFLVSVFTHMLPADLENYVGEIARMLRPGGRLVFTTFLLDFGQRFGSTEFRYGNGPWRSAHPEIPEICVGYQYDYLAATLAESGLDVVGRPLASHLRDDTAGHETTPFTQDTVIAAKAG